MNELPLKYLLVASSTSVMAMVTVDTPVGLVPASGAINTKGLRISAQDMTELCDVKPAGWADEIARIREYMDTYGARLPKEFRQELDAIASRLNT